MKYLIAEENRIVGADIAGLSGAELISLRSNLLEEVPDLTDLKKLVNLDLSHNKLVSGFEHLTELKSVKVLDLSFNAMDMTLPEFHK